MISNTNCFTAGALLSLFVTKQSECMLCCVLYVERNYKCNLVISVCLTCFKHAWTKESINVNQLFPSFRLLFSVRQERAIRFLLVVMHTLHVSRCIPQTHTGKKINKKNKYKKNKTLEDLHQLFIRVLI